MLHEDDTINDMYDTYIRYDRYDIGLGQATNRARQNKLVIPTIIILINMQKMLFYLHCAKMQNFMNVLSSVQGALKLEVALPEA